ncbi:hypothetical protein Tco_0327396 [Tanacetum coccineum]
MFCDNSAALHFTNEPGVQKGVRHYHRRYHYVRESIALGEIRFLKVYIDDNLADPFTKALPKRKLTQHVRSMGLQRVNRSLGEGIKARLEARSKNLMEERYHVLWAHRTMIKISNEDTLFSLTYGIEAVILAEIGMPTLRTTKMDIAQDNEALEVNLDLLEERREQATIREAKSKAKMEKYYNSKV